MFGMDDTKLQGKEVPSPEAVAEDVIVSPQITGRLSDLKVAEGDAVMEGQLLAVLAPEELREERSYYAASAEGVSAQVRRSEEHTSELQSH